MQTANQSTEQLVNQHWSLEGLLYIELGHKAIQKSMSEWVTRLISEQHQYAKFHIVTRCNNSTDCINVGNREKPKTRNVLKLGRNIKDFFCKTLRHTNKGCAIKIYLLTYRVVPVRNNLESNVINFSNIKCFKSSLLSCNLRRYTHF